MAATPVATAHPRGQSEESRARSTGLSQTTKKVIAKSVRRRMLWLIVAAVVLLLVCAASVALGAKGIPLDVVADALWGGRDDNDAYIVRETRIPRVVLGLIVGIALGLSGALIQAFTRNPLADPGILGVNAGAAFAVTIGIAYFGVSSIHGYVWLSFLGAAIVTVIVYVLGSAGRASISPIQLTLVGVAIGALLGGITSGITLLNPGAFDQMRDWGAGTLSGRGWDVIIAVLPFIALASLLAISLAPALNVLALGDDLASALGAKITRQRVLVVIAVTLLSGAATAAAGPIGFVGLMVPHVCRWFVGPDQRWIVAFTIVIAPILLISSDVVGRLVVAPQELQVGIVTALVGAPVLVALARRAKVSGL